jgi:hypothetical protein
VTVPGADSDAELSDNEILAVFDLEAAELYPGYKPSQAFQQESLIGIYKSKARGNATAQRMYSHVVSNKGLAMLMISGDKVTDTYNEDEHRDVDEDINKITGTEIGGPLSAYMEQRAANWADQLNANGNPRASMNFLQIDAFLVGWVAGQAAKDDGA